MTPLRKGPLKPKTDRLRVSFGVDGKDFVSVSPKGKIERKKLRGD
jgi:hypothetical protein